ncbi:MAG: hypothetical protein ACI4M6_01170 [Christensenellaceae bacterium]
MKNKTEFNETLAKAVEDDFLKRQQERKQLEQQWLLNMNFLFGNQYCEITPTGDVGEEDKYYFWQNRNVYNHIAPIVETRLAKLSRVRPKMSVRAQGQDDGDIKASKVATNVLNSTYQRLNLEAVIAKVTHWAEVCGSGFYKIIWNKTKGKSVGVFDNSPVYEGDVSITAVSPFEIFPDSLFHEEISELKSLIYAKAMNVDDVFELYGVKVTGGDVDVFQMQKVNGSGSSRLTQGVVHDSVLVLEKYEMPNSEYPLGRVITVADGKVLQVDDLPYENGLNKTRVFPFIKQNSISLAGCFFGTSVIERIIPLQRAYNAVKNRKHEFLNRVSMGVLTVEDGSIDTDELIDEGLSPGKVIVYRQGSNPPKMMQTASVPLDFTYEEDRLNNEFITVSGVSEISRSSSIPDNVTSGVAMQVLLEQDETRLNLTAENVKVAIKEIAKHIIRLFKQFAKAKRMMKIAGESRTAEVFYFNSSDLSSDDVVFDTESEISSTPAQKKSEILELLSTGLLSDDRGALDERRKAKILEIMGYGNLDNANDLTNLHIARADKENLECLDNLSVKDYDDHAIHITEHTRFLLSGESAKSGDFELIEKTLCRHISEHKRMMASGSVNSDIIKDRNEDSSLSFNENP